MNKKIELLEVNYKTKMERKEEVLKICKNLENKLNTTISSLLDIDITTDINAYLKIIRLFERRIIMELEIEDKLQEIYKI